MDSGAEESAGSASTTLQNVMMDPNIWSKTPPNILELIFARLPLQSIFQLRVLSKQWRSDLTSPAFQHAFCDERSRGFAVVEIERMDPKQIWAYDVRGRKWHGLPLAYLPFSYLVAADGGLLCFVKYTKLEEHLRVVVCNPLTCTWRELPPAVGVKRFPHAVQLKVDMISRHYTIKFLGSHNIEGPEAFCVYSSVTNSWVRQGCSSLKPNASGRHVLINVHVGSIHTCDIKPGASNNLQYPPDFDNDTVPQVEGTFPFQAEGGCCFLLKIPEGKFRSERDQELDTRWKHFSHIPKAAELQNYFFCVFLCGDVILLLGKKKPLFYDPAHEMDRDLDHIDNIRMLMFDMSTKTWTDVTNQNIDPTSLSSCIVELRLDAVR